MATIAIKQFSLGVQEGRNGPAIMPHSDHVCLTFIYKFLQVVDGYPVLPG